jgi:RNA polymerase sigma-70 factor (ECF subfamily)
MPSGGQPQLRDACYCAQDPCVEEVESLLEGRKLEDRTDDLKRDSVRSTQPVRFSPFLRHTKRENRRYVTDERILLERARQYDEAALGKLYDGYAPRIYAYIYRRVGDAQMAEDLTGDVFVRVLQAIQSERFWHTSFQAWLYRIAHNLVVDHYRQQTPTIELEMDEQMMAIEDSSEGDPASAVLERFSHQRLRIAINRLTPDQQQVLSLRFGEGMTARETAEVMDKTVGAVEALQHRALVALRRVLERE